MCRCTCCHFTRYELYNITSSFLVCRRGCMQRRLPVRLRFPGRSSSCHRRCRSVNVHTLSVQRKVHMATWGHVHLSSVYVVSFTLMRVCLHRLMTNYRQNLIQWVEKHKCSCIQNESLTRPGWLLFFLKMARRKDPSHLEMSVKFIHVQWPWCLCVNALRENKHKGNCSCDRLLVQTFIRCLNHSLYKAECTFES